MKGTPAGVLTSEQFRTWLEPLVARLGESTRTSRPAFDALDRMGGAFHTGAYTVRIGDNEKDEIEFLYVPPARCSIGRTDKDRRRAILQSNSFHHNATHPPPSPRDQWLLDGHRDEHSANSVNSAMQLIRGGQSLEENKR